MIQTFGLIATVAIHVALLIGLLWEIEKVPLESPPPQNEIEVRLIPMDKAEDEKPLEGTVPKNATISELECTGKKYFGIGILHTTMVITDAPKQYAAYKAGLRIGDSIVQMYHENGLDYLNVEIERHGTFLKFRIRKEEICFLENEPKIQPTWILLFDVESR